MMSVSPAGIADSCERWCSLIVSHVSRIKVVVQEKSQCGDEDHMRVHFIRVAWKLAMRAYAVQGNVQ